jgi:hypothetical protein
MLLKHKETPFFMLIQKDLHLPNKDFVLEILYGSPPLCYNLFEFNNMYLNGTSPEMMSNYINLLIERGFCTLDSAKSIQLLTSTCKEKEMEQLKSIREKHEFFFPYIFDPTDYNLELQNKRQFVGVTQEMEIDGETRNIIRIPDLLKTMGVNLSLSEKKDIGIPIYEYMRTVRFIHRHKMRDENFTFRVYYPSDVPDMMHPIKVWLMGYINKRLNGISIQSEELDKILEDTGSISERIHRLINF